MQDYFKNYEDMQEKVDLACQCIDSNGCMSLQSEIENIKSVINQLNLYDKWQDSMGDTFSNVISTCNKGLDTIINSIKSNFQDSEKYYKELKQDLEDLKINNKNYQDKYNDPPKESKYNRFKTVEVNGVKTSEWVFDRNAYDEAVINWNNEVLNYSRDCEELIERIDSNKKELDKINEINVESDVITNLFTLQLNRPLEETEILTESPVSTTNSNNLEVLYTTEIPSDIQQSNYTVTCYEYDGWHLGGSKKATRVGVGSGQKLVHDAWNKDGSQYENGIAVIDDNGTKRYLVACSSEIGKVGDRLTYHFENGQSIDALVADQKSSGDRNYTKYGHKYGGKINILELEVNTSDYNAKGNPTTEKWGLPWDSSSRIVSIDNLGSSKGDLVSE